MAKKKEAMKRAAAIILAAAFLAAIAAAMPGAGASRDCARLHKAAVLFF